MTKQELLAMGGNAPLGEDLFDAFPIDYRDIARKELANIGPDLGVTTVGELNTTMWAEKLDRFELKCSSEALMWFEEVFHELGVGKPANV